MERLASREVGQAGKFARYGMIDWLFRQYKTEKAYTEKVSPRSRPDYERIMQIICDRCTTAGSPFSSDGFCPGESLTN